MTGIRDSARKHRTEYRIQVAGLIVIIAACAVSIAILVIRFRLALP